MTAAKTPPARPPAHPLLKRWRRTAALLLALALAAPVALAKPQLVTQVNQRGDFVLIGNTLGQTCASDVPKPAVGTVSNCRGNDRTGTRFFWRSDSPHPGNAEANENITPTQARSTAVLALPAGSMVTHAWLYWAANQGADPLPANPTATFERPGAGGFSQTVTADGTVTATASDDIQVWYRSRVDVTALVQQHGAGAYRVGNIPTLDFRNSTQIRSFAGWWMVVFYQLPSDSLRHLALYDGLDIVQNPNWVSAALSGFTVPRGAVGPVDAKLGVVGLSGEAAYAKDKLLVNNNELIDARNPRGNFFNGTHSQRGAAVSTAGDLPQTTGAPDSLSGIDLDVVDIGAHLRAGATSANLRATSLNDVYSLPTFVTSIPTLWPLLSDSSMSVNAGALPTDTLTYTTQVRNSGVDAAVRLLLTSAPLPAGLTYVPGSLRVGGSPMTDAAGDDAAEYNAATRTITARLGTGATATVGGELAVDEAITVTYQATVDAFCSGNKTFSHQATLSGWGKQTNQSVSAQTDGVPGTPGSQPTDTEIDVRCLSLAFTGPGQGSLSSGGSSRHIGFSGGASQWAVPYSTNAIELRALPGGAAVFGGWSGDASGTANPTSTVMDADRSVSAHFLAVQTIDFPAPNPASRLFVPNQSFAITLATVDSPLTVGHRSQDPRVCSIVGATVTMLAPGDCTIVAEQPGDENYAPAVSVSHRITLLAPIDGQCGSAHGGTTPLATAPTAQLCSAGTATSVTSASAWTWSCTGDHGGSTASCQAPRGYILGATVSGLTGAGLVLQNNGGDDLSAPANGSVAFAALVLHGGSYAVSVRAQPDGQRCTVTQGSGTAMADVGDVQVACAPHYEGPIVPATGGASGAASASFTGGGAACHFDLAATGFEAAPAQLPPGQTMPQGAFRFRLTGCDPGATVQMTITWPDAVTGYTKHGKASASAAQSSHFAPDNLSINGHTVTFSVTDGALGDDDWTADGAISDPSGPTELLAAPAAVQPVPTLPAGGLALLATLLALAALRRRV